MKTEMFHFETANFVIRATIEPDNDLDLSWDEDGETAAKLDSGEYCAFGTVVTVETKEGVRLGHSSLWGSIYSDPEEFFTAHRGPDPMDRNCSIMRAAKGANVAICHYFPGLVQEAIGEARKALANMPHLHAAH